MTCIEIFLSFLLTKALNDAAIHRFLSWPRVLHLMLYQQIESNRTSGNPISSFISICEKLSRFRQQDQQCCRDVILSAGKASHMGFLSIPWTQWNISRVFKYFNQYLYQYQPTMNFIDSVSFDLHYALNWHDPEKCRYWLSLAS